MNSAISFRIFDKAFYFIIFLLGCSCSFGVGYNSAQSIGLDAVVNRIVQNCIQRKAIENCTTSAVLIVKAIELISLKPTNEIEHALLEFRNVTITGRLTINAHRIPFPLKISATFRDEVDFRDTTFLRNVLFNCAFKSNVYFEGAVFEGTAHLACIFQEFAHFRRTTFFRRCDFSSSFFRGNADFSGGVFQDEVMFVGTTFNRESNFGNLSDDPSLVSRRTRFESNVDFVGSEFHDNVSFDRAIFSQEVSFRNTKVITDIDFEGATFEHSAVVSNSQWNAADFSRATFQGHAEFFGTTFTNSLALAQTTFEDAVSFVSCRLPIPKVERAAEQVQDRPGIAMNGVRFQKAIQLDWNELQHGRSRIWPWHDPKVKLLDPVIATWEELENAFARSGNLRGQNESMYQKNILATRKALFLFVDYLSWLIWGYGLRPMRLVVWMMVAFVLLTIVYCMQTKLPKFDWTHTSSSQWRRQLVRAWYGLLFATRTSWRWNYGYKHTSIPILSALAFMYGAVFKIASIFLLISLGNISPLVRQILDKLLPN